NGDERDSVPPLSRRSNITAPPLSFAQERLWFLGQFMGPNAVYNIPLALGLSGEIHETVLLGSLKAIVDRHESLRTHFELRDGSPVQIVRPVSSVQFEVQAIDAEQLDAICRAERIYCFDLSKDSLCRIRVLKKQTDDYVLL